MQKPSCVQEPTAPKKNLLESLGGILLVVDRQLQILLLLDSCGGIWSRDGQYTVRVHAGLHSLQLHALRESDKTFELTDGVVILSLIFVLCADHQLTSISCLDMDIFRLESLDIEVVLHRLLAVVIDDLGSDRIAVHQGNEIGKATFSGTSLVLALHAVQLSHHVAHLSIVVSENLIQAEWINVASADEEWYHRHGSAWIGLDASEKNTAG